MLDIQFILKNQEEIKKAIKNKNINLDLDKLVEFYEKKNGCRKS
jgi:seryl-tRNA synthetase